MRNLLYIIILILAAGCSRSVSEVMGRLDEAESMMAADPAAAMDHLNRLDVAAMDDSAQVARWALLYSEALALNGLAAPSDTIVDVAIGYYGRHGTDAMLHRARRVKQQLCGAPSAPDQLAEARYLQKERELMLYKERAASRQFMLIGVVALLLAAGVIGWQRQRMKINRLRTATLMAEASGLRAGLQRRQDECSALEAKLSESADTRFRIIDELCETYYESQGTKNERKMIADKVRAHIDAIKDDKGIFADMEKCVNDCRGGLLHKLRAEWPAIGPDDYRLAVYLASNLSNRTIALLAGESIDVIYKRKSRLKAKLKSQDLPDAALFLTIFD